MKSKPAIATSQQTDLPKQLPISGASPTVQRELGEVLQASFSRPEKSASNKEPASGNFSIKKIAMAFLIPAIIVVAAFSLYFWPRTKPVRIDLITHVVKPEKLQVTILERGTLEALDNKDIVCQVRSGSKGSSFSTTIKWVIDDGSHVKQNDLIVELDDSGLQEQLKSQQIARDRARNDFIQAEANYDIVKSQNESDIATAEIAIELSALDLEKFQEGDYKQQLAEVEGRFFMAESDLSMWNDRDVWLDRMVSKGYLTPKQALADRFKLKSAEFSVEKVKEELRVLKDYTKKRTLTELKSKKDESKRAKDRLTTQSKSKEIQGINDTLTKKSIFSKEELRFKDIEDEIKKCYLLAPQDGLVVYYVSEQARFGSGSQQATIAQGEPVREGQKLMRIPNLTHMMVNTKVHEAMRNRIRGDQWKKTGYGEIRLAGLSLMSQPLGVITAQAAYFEVHNDFTDKEQELIDNGLPATIRIDSFPDKVMQGHVKHVDEVASQSDWLTSDVRVYRTLISIDESLPDLKPGMSASVTIYTDTKADDVLAIPVQAVLGNTQSGFFCFTLTPDGPIEKAIKLGVSNEKMIEIKDGLNENDVVVLNPKSLSRDAKKDSSKAEKPDAPTSPGSKKKDKKSKTKSAE